MTTSSTLEESKGISLRLVDKSSIVNLLESFKTYTKKGYIDTLEISGNFVIPNIFYRVLPQYINKINLVEITNFFNFSIPNHLEFLDVLLDISNLVSMDEKVKFSIPMALLRTKYKATECYTMDFKVVYIIEKA